MISEERANIPKLRELAEAARAVAGCTNVNDLLAEFSVWLQQLVSCDCFCLGVFDEGSPPVSLYSGTTRATPFECVQSALEYAAVAGVLEVVQGGAVSIADLSSEPDLLVKLAPLPLDGVHSLCLLPLANNDERTGFLALGRLEGGFGEEEVEIASVFAAQVALALELTQARMRSQVVQ